MGDEPGGECQQHGEIHFHCDHVFRFEVNHARNPPPVRKCLKQVIASVMFGTQLAIGMPRLTIAASAGRQFRLDDSDALGSGANWHTMTNFTMTGLTVTANVFGDAAEGSHHSRCLSQQAHRLLAMQDVKQQASVLAARLPAKPIRKNIPDQIQYVVGARFRSPMPCPLDHDFVNIERRQHPGNPPCPRMVNVQ